MNAEMVANELVKRGYRKVSRPLQIAEMEFDFAEALIGPGGEESLTLVLEGDRATLLSAQRRLRAFTVVLDRTGSTRPINVVVLALEPDNELLAALGELARVIVVDFDRPLSESIFALFPLELPPPLGPAVSAEKALAEEIGDRRGPAIPRLMKAARSSAEEVRAVMQSILLEAQKPVE